MNGPVGCGFRRATVRPPSVDLDGACWAVAESPGGDEPGEHFEREAAGPDRSVVLHQLAGFLDRGAEDVDAAQRLVGLDV